jgi:hypothetical protein
VILKRAADEGKTKDESLNCNIIWLRHIEAGRP